MRRFVITIFVLTLIALVVGKFAADRLAAHVGTEIATTQEFRDSLPAKAAERPRLTAEQVGSLFPRPTGPEEDRLLSGLRQWVEARLERHRQEFEPSDAQIEEAVRAAIHGGPAAQGVGSWFAGTIARVVWRAFQLLLAAGLVALFVTYWGPITAFVATVVTVIAWPAGWAGGKSATKGK
jgi:hypothetical protein